jgi:hypothetical protein
MLGVLLAGCGANTSGAGQVRLGDGSHLSLDLPSSEAPKPDDIRGAVSGVVVDEAIFPLANATIAVRERDWKATTDAQGRFSLLDEPPGLYTLVVSHDGYADGLGTVNIHSGEVTKAIVQVQRLPFIQPYHTTTEIQVLHEQTDTWTVGDPSYVVPFDRPPATVIVEGVWEPLTVAPGIHELNYVVQPESDHSKGDTGGGANPLRLEYKPDFLPKGEYAVRVQVVPDRFALPAESRGRIFVTIFYQEPAPAGWSIAGGST